MPFHHKVKDKILGDEDTRYQKYREKELRKQDKYKTEQSEKREKDYWASFPHTVKRTVDLREYEAGWKDNPMNWKEGYSEEWESRDSVSIETARAVFNYIGKRLYGQNAVEELETYSIMYPPGTNRANRADRVNAGERLDVMYMLSYLDLIELE